VKILYGICGDGLGHASRGRILIHYLQQQNHEVCIIVGGKSYTILSKEFGKELAGDIGTNKAGDPENIQRKEVMRSYSSIE
jgi:uncharacterized protein (TIGR00661 family)